ncbi:hypothetical protein GALMADRAFT_409848 [Galerina marginata CBS 339.88]|uniref:Peptidase A1 domain-containing protein n=1 Tax=Galerina marginata (strain CBS 339.88) TaxID=685588 RepID=A0A067T3D8_GALM3|nr:hypothetical protein GALMADRAFT_409848 [Galerina marginata CBS 339.88]
MSSTPGLGAHARRPSYLVSSCFLQLEPVPSSKRYPCSLFLRHRRRLRLSCVGLAWMAIMLSGLFRSFSFSSFLFIFSFVLFFPPSSSCPTFFPVLGPCVLCLCRCLCLLCLFWYLCQLFVPVFLLLLLSWTSPSSSSFSSLSLTLTTALTCLSHLFIDLTPSAYTIPVKFSQNSQQFSLQVDTGSSDLWVASTSCSTSSCSLTQGRLYDPSSSSVSTGETFSIPYLQGSASGPIVWDRVELGGYTIDNQALAAANNVQSEPLSPKFSGILGLALPLNSIIAESIPPVTNNNPDGAAFASNLFSLTPTPLAPSSRFLSLALARPGSDTIPSVLGIGRHPSSLVPDPSKVKYDALVSDRAGSLFWKASVRGITVYVNGQAKVVDVGRGNGGGVFPSAVLDSGVPLVLTSSAVANAVYGAIGVSPGSDGMYYVPCTTPLNLTITLDTRPEIPIHPLDLTAYPPTDNTAQFCIGLIQPADAQLGVGAADKGIGDMILGVPFLRNVYTVMAYTVPEGDGGFADLSGNGTGDGSGTDGGLSQTIRPRLGLMSLTDPETALKEFNTVRVLNQPLTSGSGSGPGGGGANTGSDTNTKTVDVGGKKLPVGIVVLVAVLGFFALCGLLFGVRWVVYRRRFRRGRKGEDGDKGMGGMGALGMGGLGGMGGMGLDQKSAYRLARRTSGSGTALGFADVLSEEELRDMRYKAYLRKEKRSDSTVDSDRTRVGAAGGWADEFGYVKREEDGEGGEEEVWDPRTGVPVGVGWERTVVAGRERSRGRGEQEEEQERPLVADRDPTSPELAVFPLQEQHQRTYSDPDSDAEHLALAAAAAGVGVNASANAPHKQTLSVDEPLLPLHQRGRSEEYRDHPPVHGPVPLGLPLAGSNSNSNSNANANATSIMHRYALEDLPAQPQPQQQHRYTLDDVPHDVRSAEGEENEHENLDEQDDLGELGLANGVTMSMAGVGTASRTHKLRGRSGSGSRSMSMGGNGNGNGTAADRDGDGDGDPRSEWFGRESFVSVSSVGAAVGVGVDGVGGRGFSPVNGSGSGNGNGYGYGRSLAQARPEMQKWTLTDPPRGAGAGAGS